MKSNVIFQKNEKPLAGHLYLPDSYESGERLPGIVVTGAWTTVKEQMPTVYAAKLAKHGYAVLTFDFRGWGASPDDVSYLEDPKRKTEDILAAVTYLASRPEVDANRVGGFGICASSGYMSDAALQSEHIKSLALVAPWLHNAEIVKEVYGGEDGVSSLIEAGRKAAASPKPIYVEAASSTNEDALMYQAPYYSEKERGLIPEYDNKFNVASWEPWLTFDALKTARTLSKPTILVHSEAAAIPQGATEYAKRMGGKAKAIWLDGVTQFDFYDDAKAVQAATDAVAQHFNATLKAD